MIEDLRQALIKIISECNKHDYNCVGCPLSTSYNVCGIVGDVGSSDTISRKPRYWKIISEYSLFKT